MEDFNIDYDISGIKAVVESCRKASTKHLRFGWLSGKQYPASHKNKGLYIAQVAEWQEYGTLNIPARPYAMLAFLKTTNSALPYIEDYFKSACYGQFSEDHLTNIADEGKKNYRDSVAGQGYKALAYSTIRIKGNTYQMDHTGVLLDDYDVKVFKTSMDKIDERAL